MHDSALCEHLQRNHIYKSLLFNRVLGNVYCHYSTTASKVLAFLPQAKSGRSVSVSYNTAVIRELEAVKRLLARVYNLTDKLAFVFLLLEMVVAMDKEPTWLSKERQERLKLL